MEGIPALQDISDGFKSFQLISKEFMDLQSGYGFRWGWCETGGRFNMIKGV